MRARDAAKRLHIPRKPTVGFEPTTPALRERCSGQLSYVGGTREQCSPGRWNDPGVASEQRNRLLAALDPRVPIYRDAYNEYFVLVLSAGGAAAGTQVPLYIVMAITGLWSVGAFVLACVVFELAVIFGLARPQMKRHERVGWAGLWAASTALLAVCFYYLVAERTL
jgi:hypothetical protein